MITVTYERYWDDFMRKTETRDFPDLAALEDWIFRQMQRDYSGDNRVMSFPTPEKAERIPMEAPWAIKFRPKYGGEIFHIQMIESGQYVLFTDGTHTSGKRHWSDEVKTWLTHCEERRKAPEFNFAG